MHLPPADAGPAASGSWTLHGGASSRPRPVHHPAIRPTDRSSDGYSRKTAATGLALDVERIAGETRPADQRRSRPIIQPSLAQPIARLTARRHVYYYYYLLGTVGLGSNVTVRVTSIGGGCEIVAPRGCLGASVLLRTVVT